MKPWLALLPVALSASAADAAFAPVVDRPYRYETSETRTDGDMVRRFHVRRTIVFSRTETGYEAVVTLEAVDQQADGDIGRMFAAATGALLQHPVRFRLDRAGTVSEVVDADAAIALIADAIERMAAPSHERSNHSKALASPLRAMAPERKAAMLRSILLPVLAGTAADRPSGARDVTMPSRPPLPRGTNLEGRETVSRGSTGIITIDIRAQGGVDAPAPGTTPGAAIAMVATAPVVTVHSVRNVDPVTGLLRDSVERCETTVAGGEARHVTRADTAITVALPK